ncbi:hypothetical protein MOQ_007335 [Trypanosoma cruzi marinkellei]|uniref:Uncharacterized protein n=1 Tax=Trypanosoma cruzi marinkellei TaxID=85056 RepID=K2MP60_TRYCR|nr:hypothetical protein MOQ_007335 [Trypanosoma cruzi marinkellei]
MDILQECRHQSTRAMRPIGCSDFHQACSGRGLLGAPHLAVRAPVAACTNRVETTAFRVCPPACPGIYVVNLYGLPRQWLTLLTLRATLFALVPAASIACDRNSHHELPSGCPPSATTGEDFDATPSGMDSELSDDPAQATRISGRGVSFPDVTAQRVLRASHWTSTSCMDSDHHLPLYSAETEDGPLRQAGILSRRKHAALVLRDADWNAPTSACGTPLAAVDTWLEMHRGTGRAARRILARSSRDSPTGIWADGMEHAECVAAAACNAHTALPGDSLLRTEFLRKLEDRNHALSSGFSTTLLLLRAKKLGVLWSLGL